MRLISSNRKTLQGGGVRGRAATHWMAGLAPAQPTAVKPTHV